MKSNPLRALFWSEDQLFNLCVQEYFIFRDVEILGKFEHWVGAEVAESGAAQLDES